MWKIGCCGLTIELPTNLAESRKQLPAPRLLLRTAIGPVNFTRSRGSFEVEHFMKLMLVLVKKGRVGVKRRQPKQSLLTIMGSEGREGGGRS